MRIGSRNGTSSAVKGAAASSISLIVHVVVCRIDDSTDKVSSACSTPLTGFAEAKLLALTSKALVSTAAFGRGDDVARLAFGMLVIPVKNVMQKLNDVSVRTSLRHLGRLGFHQIVFKASSSYPSPMLSEPRAKA